MTQDRNERPLLKAAREELELTQAQAALLLEKPIPSNYLSMIECGRRSGPGVKKKIRKLCEAYMKIAQQKKMNWRLFHHYQLCPRDFPLSCPNGQAPPLEQSQ